MPTLSERFVGEKRLQWLQLRMILIKIRDLSYSSLQDEEIAEFARLYRLACADLAQARTLKLSPDVLQYLNNIVGQAHKYLYSFQPVRGSQVKEFFTATLPGILRQHKNVVLLAALFFFVPYLVTFFLCLMDPDKAALLIPGPWLEQIAESYKETMADGRGVAMSTAALSFYIYNNVSIAFFSFAGGVLFGLGTIYFLVYNGISLGAISGYITAQGYGKNLLVFITAHSVLELSGLVVAGAAGLLLGYTIIKASKFTKKDQLARQRTHIFTLVCAAALMIACAAALEGWVSPQPLPYPLKLTAAVCSAAFLVYYFGLLPLKREKKRRSGTVIMLAAVLLFLAAPLPGQARTTSGNPPTRDEVLEAHRDMMKEYGVEEKKVEQDTQESAVREIEIEEDSRNSTSFLEWLRGLSLPAIIIIVAVLIVIFYFLFRGMPGFFRSRAESPPVQKAAPLFTGDSLEKVESSDDGYRMALELAKTGEYGKALIVLHKASLKKLQENRWIPLGKNFTNNDIRRLLQKAGIESGITFPFSQLAVAAERAAFKKENPDRHIYMELKSIYESAFLEMQTGKRP